MNSRRTVAIVVIVGLLAAGMLPGREVHVVDSRSASMGVGLLALLAVELAAAGHSAREIAANLEVRRADLDLRAPSMLEVGA